MYGQNSPSMAIALDATFLTYNDLLEYERETGKRKEETKKLREKREAAKKEAQACKDELANKMELDKKLTEDTKRCKALMMKLENEMNVSKAKYKCKIHELKNQVENDRNGLKQCR
ncbi:hypothetical protein ACOSQ3_007394 [Xanthoceras sorbifolium]